MPITHFQTFNMSMYTRNSSLSWTNLYAAYQGNAAHTGEDKEDIFFSKGQHSLVFGTSDC